MSNLPISGLPTGLPVSDTDLLADTQASGTGPVQITASGLKTYIGNGLTLTNAVINSPFSINGVNYSWPSSNGPSGSVITNDGAGNLTWSLNPLAGTVTSVNVSGGLTGLTTINGPITSVGTIDLAGVLNVAHGGTGGTNRTSAMMNILPPISSTTAAYALFNDGIGTYYWAYAGGGSAPGVLNISTGTTGLLANGSSGNVNGNVLLSGVLKVSNGGTGISSLGAAGQVLTSDPLMSNTTAVWDYPRAAGADGEIQFNNADRFAASPNFTFADGLYATLTLGKSGSANGDLRLQNILSPTGHVRITVDPNSTTSWMLTLPTDGGSVGQVLTTDGTGITSWTTPPSGIEVGVTTITSGTAGSIPYNNGTVYSEDNANLFWDDTAKQLSIGTNTTATTPADIQLQVVKDALIAGMTVGLGPAQGATNTAVGKSVLAANTVDGNLTGIGVEALTANTSGIRNTAVGYQSAYSNTIGNQNTAFGAYALYYNDADNNTGLGFQACSFNVSGTNNTAVGANTLAASGADSQNTAVGSNVLNAFTGGNNNTAVGAFAAQVLQGGTDNTFIGANASGISNTSVDRNTGVGSRSLENTSSSNNTAVGVESLQSNTANTGGNTAVGYRSLRNCQGARNTSIGRLAMSFDTVTGAENTALGISALGSLTSGNYNTALGKSAGFGITSGSSNTLVGAYDAGAAPISGTGSNYIVLSDGDGNVPVFWEGLTRNQICNGPVVTQGYTVAGLAAIASPIVGMRVHVTDANAPSFLATLAGGGSIRCPAFYDGTNWVAG